MPKNLPLIIFISLHSPVIYLLSPKISNCSGLYLSKKIINKMNGDIYVKSVVGEETEFVIIIPIEVLEFELLNSSFIKSDVNLGGTYKPSISLDKKIEDEIKIKIKKNILIADDNYINRDIIKDILETFEYKVTLFEDGKEILDYCKINKPCEIDCILMDIHMPVMDGRESTISIRKLKGYGNVKIIAYTASVFRMEELFKYNFTDILSKPATVSSIKQMLLKHSV
jgi:CheY-like chemotaxis protein